MSDYKTWKISSEIHFGQMLLLLIVTIEALQLSMLKSI
jgi:hypothetical protein